MYYSYLHNTRRVQGMYSSNKKQTGRKTLIAGTLMFLVGCAVPPADWTKVKPPPVTPSLIQAGFFEIDNFISSQHCGPKGNQIWKQWDKKQELW